MINNNHNLLHLIMLDFSYMLQLKLLVVDRIHLQRNKSAKVVKSKATGHSKIKVRPTVIIISLRISVFPIMISGCIAWTLNNSKLWIIWAIIVKFQNVWKTSKLYNIYPKADFWETCSLIVLWESWYLQQNTSRYQNWQEFLCWLQLQ